MKFVANILIIFGLCLGTLGAAGFHSPSISANGQQGTEVTDPGTTTENAAAASGDSAPSRESEAMLFFLGGVGLLIGGGVLSKFASGSGAIAQEEQHAQGAALLGQLGHIEEVLRALHGKAATMDHAELHKEITVISEGPIYDLTSEFEHWTEILGFDRYSKVWTGVAAGERLVHRAWSMDTDGHSEEAIEELRFAADAFSDALAQLKG
ncbi:MAG: hypothetical protein P1V35_12810 [Planctomycetota bacterium]|nr:hypothetical protein [Planctomycetota bacterium]